MNVHLYKILNQCPDGSMDSSELRITRLTPLHGASPMVQAITSRPSSVMSTLATSSATTYITSSFCVNPAVRDIASTQPGTSRLLIPETIPSRQQSTRLQGAMVATEANDASRLDGLDSIGLPVEVIDEIREARNLMDDMGSRIDAMLYIIRCLDARQRQLFDTHAPGS